MEYDHHTEFSQVAAFYVGSNDNPYLDNSKDTHVALSQVCGFAVRGSGPAEQGFNENGQPKNEAIWRYGYYTLTNGNRLDHHGEYATRKAAEKARKQKTKFLRRPGTGKRTWVMVCGWEAWWVLVALLDAAENKPSLKLAA